MYKIYIVAFPQDCDLEERLDEMLMNYEFDIAKPTYSCIIEDVKMNNVPEDLENYLKNGFKEEK